MTAETINRNGHPKGVTSKLKRIVAGAATLLVALTGAVALPSIASAAVGDDLPQGSATVTALVPVSYEGLDVVGYAEVTVTRSADVDSMPRPTAAQLAGEEALSPVTFRVDVEAKRLGGAEWGGHGMGRLVLTERLGSSWELVGSGPDSSDDTVYIGWEWISGSGSDFRVLLSGDPNSEGVFIASYSYEAVPVLDGSDALSDFDPGTATCPADVQLIPAAIGMPNLFSEGCAAIGVPFEKATPELGGQNQLPGDDTTHVSAGLNSIVAKFTNIGDDALRDLVFSSVAEQGDEVVWDADDLAALTGLVLEPSESVEIRGTVDVPAGTANRNVATLTGVGVTSGVEVSASDPTTLVAELLAVTPAAPELIPADECGVEGAVNVPATEGVVYAETRDGSVVTVTAEAADGYVFTDGAAYRWTFDVSAEECPQPEQPVLVTPLDPTIELSTECGVANTLVIPEVEGVEYTVHPADEDGDFRITAEALEGFEIAEGAPIEWEANLGEVEDCPIVPEPEQPVASDVKKGAVTGDPLASTGGTAGLLAGGTALLLAAAAGGTALLRRKLRA